MKVILLQEKISVCVRASSSSKSSIKESSSHFVWRCIRTGGRMRKCSIKCFRGDKKSLIFLNISILYTHIYHNLRSMIPRFYNLSEKVMRWKVTIIYWPRRIGKTVMLKEYIKTLEIKPILYTGEDLRIQAVMNSKNLDTILAFVEGKDHLIIDEAQYIDGIGLGLKMLIDARPDITCIVTGSSSFDLSQSIGEPLVGRCQILTLFPIWQGELLSGYNRYELKEHIEDFLIYGAYPEVFSLDTKNEKRDYLESLVNSLLLKDILELERVKSSQVVMNLLRLLAFQVGSLVSYTELAMKVWLNQKTVERYLDLLEKSFIIKRVWGYSRNMRKEITQKAKYYFYDVGIRNAIISAWNPLELRDDVGALWENWIWMERYKKRKYTSLYGETYFWRTHDGQEVDIIEERDGRIYGYECKWSEGKDLKIPKDWQNIGNVISLVVVNRVNYMDFIL